MLKNLQSYIDGSFDVKKRDHIDYDSISHCRVLNICLNVSGDECLCASFLYTWRHVLACRQIFVKSEDSGKNGGGREECQVCGLAHTCWAWQTLCSVLDVIKTSSSPKTGLSTELIDTLVKFMEQLPEGTKHKGAFSCWVSHRSWSLVTYSQKKDLEHCPLSTNPRDLGWDLVYLEINIGWVATVVPQKENEDGNKKRVGLCLRFSG